MFGCGEVILGEYMGCHSGFSSCTSCVPRGSCPSFLLLCPLSGFLCFQLSPLLFCCSHPAIARCFCTGFADYIFYTFVNVYTYVQSSEFSPKVVLNLDVLLMYFINALVAFSDVRMNPMDDALRLRVFRKVWRSRAYCGQSKRR